MKITTDFNLKPRVEMQNGELVGPKDFIDKLRREAGISACKLENISAATHPILCSNRTSEMGFRSFVLLLDALGYELVVREKR